MEEGTEKMKLETRKIGLPTIDPLLKKLASGRFILVLCAGFVFAWCATHGKLDAKDVVLILVLVFRDYFGRDRSTEKGESE